MVQYSGGGGGIAGVQGGYAPLDSGLHVPLQYLTGGRQLIQRQTLNVNTVTVTFASIPQTFADLELVIWGRGTAAQWFCDVNIQFNTDSGSNYIGEHLYATASTPTAASLAVSTSGIAGLLPGSSLSSSYSGTSILYIAQYASTAFFKTYTVRSINMGDTVVNVMRSIVSAAGWLSTAAITRIDLGSDATSFAAGCVFSLYGVQ